MTFEETLAKLCNLNGISGDESEVASFIIEQIEDYCDEVRVDNMGSVIALKKGAKTPAKKIMLDAHMDEVGMIVTGFTADGGLTFATVGGVDSRVIIGRKVLVGEEEMLLPALGVIVLVLVLLRPRLDKQNSRAETPEEKEAAS